MTRPRYFSVLSVSLWFALVLCGGLTACHGTAEPTPRPAALCTILPLGDSITQGRSAYPGYRRDLWLMLAGAGYDVDFVGSLDECNEQRRAPDPDEYDLDHDGHWGWRADEILDGASWRPGEGKLDDWLKGYTPDVVLVHLGTNDLWQGESTASIVADLERIIDTLRADNPDVVILLAQLIPSDGTWYEALLPYLGDCAASPE